MQKQNKAKKQNICLLCKGKPSAMQSCASHNSGTLFRLNLIFHLYIYLIMFKVVTGLFSYCQLSFQYKSRNMISQLTKLHLYYGFSIGDHKVLLEQLSKILGAYSRQQTIGYNHVLFNYVRIIYKMRVHISWCYKSSFVNISCQFVCFCFFSLQVFACQQTSMLLLQLVMCPYKKKLVKRQDFTNSFSFSEFYCNTK